MSNYKFNFTGLINNCTSKNELSYTNSITLTFTTNTS
ncbi:hypothetical protein MOMOMM089B2_19170 [Morganella morganii]